MCDDSADFQTYMPKLKPNVTKGTKKVEWEKRMYSASAKQKGAGSMLGALWICQARCFRNQYALLCFPLTRAPAHASQRHLNVLLRRML
jgi:hypothetical protein